MSATMTTTGEESKLQAKYNIIRIVVYYTT
jgi:hypothetical protein